jgi:predicted amidohydrolase YtcJ
MAVSPPDLAPDLAPVGAALARCGVTGVTDATATNDANALALLSGAVAGGALPQRLVVMGDPSLPEPQTPGVTRGAVKLVLAEATGLDFGHVVDAISGAHAGGRPLAVHCVTRAELVLALGAFDAAGVAPGDRSEHASIAPPELAAHLAALGLAVVTQPHFVAERGDASLQEVGPDDLPWLYRCQGLVSAGVALGAGTDAPFGDPDPWRAMQAAVERRTAGGASLGRCEALSPERALALFTTPAGSPGGPPREIAPGAPADLCLLDRPWARARDQLDASCVVATITGGKTTWRRSP